MPGRWRDACCKHLRTSKIRLCLFFPPTRTWLSVSSINTSCGFFFFFAITLEKSLLRDTDKKEMLLHPLSLVHTKYESNYKPGAVGLKPCSGLLREIFQNPNGNQPHQPFAMWGSQSCCAQPSQPSGLPALMLL